MYNCLCDTCFKEFASDKLVHICDNCKSKNAIERHKTRDTKSLSNTSLCGACTNYWTCGKKDSVTVRAFMKKYELKLRQYKNEPAYYCLAVYKCEKYKTR